MRKIHAAVTHRVCPSSECGYLVNQKIVDKARLNFKCPKCNGYKFSDFQPLCLSSQDRDVVE